MLLAEDPLDMLVERLRGLKAGDRRAVLAHLSASERTRLAAIRGETASLKAPEKPYSPDLAARISDPSHPALTPAARETLRRVILVIVPQPLPSASLATVIAQRLRGRR